MIMNFIKRCWAELSVDALLSNLEKIKNITGDMEKLMCVVKANAYGHGDAEIVKILESAGVKHFAVAAMSEAVHLRKNGVTAEILILGGCLSDCYQYAAAYGVTLAVYDKAQAKQMSDAAVLFGKTIKAHVKLNTGMSRIGFDCTTQSVVDIVEVCKMPGLDVCGAFTHFAVSDEPDGGEYTRFQTENFQRIKRMLDKCGVTFECWHCANSGAIMNYPELQMDLVRAGIVLYGLYNGVGADTEFEPVLSLKTVITQIRELEKGTSVSYGRTYVTDKKTKIATVSIGYADGYPRLLSNKGVMLVDGKYAPIIGRVCMDQTMIDVTDIECKVGDTVTVIGKEGNNEISAQNIAEMTDTINYEIVCNISSRVPRIYFKNGEIIKVAEYI